MKKQLLIFWNCTIWGSHKWTSRGGQRFNNPELYPPIHSVEDFKEDIRMYCNLCGKESELSKKFREKI